jgi:multidrug efflux pump subunit AcrA (membrane-fusion protein)
LVERGLATQAELDAFERRRDEANRELDAFREHRSRLTQELEQAESELRLLEIQGAAAPRGASATAEADYADAEAACQAIQERLERLRITAPSGGTVLSIDVREGERISAGAKLAQIADLSTLTISAPVNASVARSIRVGRLVSVLLPGEVPLRASAKVDEVTLVPDPVQQAYLIKAVIPNPDPETVFVGLEAQLEIDHLDAL